MLFLASLIPHWMSSVLNKPNRLDNVRELGELSDSRIWLILSWLRRNRNLDRL